MGKPQLFCSKPFSWFEVSGSGKSRGDVYLCCPAWLDTPIGNLQRQSVAKVWNSRTARAIRASILDGSFRYCSHTRCPMLQTVSGAVRRVEDVQDPEHLRILERRETRLRHGPREVNCSHDRSCNLSCPTCRDRVIVETDAATEILAIQEKLSDEALRDAKTIYITGSGDAFGSPFFSQWLRDMDVAAMPSLERIHLHTNAQLWTPERWATIPAATRAKVTTAEISIDAARPETYAVNRRGGRFDKLVTNLEFIASLRRDGPLRFLTISMVVQQNNYREMPEFAALGRRFGVDSVSFSQLVNWGTFSGAEFRQRAVHLAAHDEHAEFAEVLRDASLQEPPVYLGNLTETQTATAADG